MKKYFSIAVTFCILFIVNACTHDPIGTPAAEFMADTVSFQYEILPLIVSNCATTGCHDALSRKKGLNLTNYSNIKNISEYVQ